MVCKMWWSSWFVGNTVVRDMADVHHASTAPWDLQATLPPSESTSPETPKHPPRHPKIDSKHPTPVLSLHFLSANVQRSPNGLKSIAVHPNFGALWKNRARDSCKLLHQSAPLLSSAWCTSASAPCCCRPCARPEIQVLALRNFRWLHVLKPIMNHPQQRLHV